MTTPLAFQTVEDRDAMLQSGMKEEMVEIMDLLAELVESRASQKRAAPAR